MDEILGVTASAATGGLMGVLGTALGRVLGFFERRESYAHEQARWAHERQLHELNREMQAAETEQEIAVLAARGSYEGLADSIEASARATGGSYRWVEAVRALVRPILTPLLWVLYLAVFFAVLNGNAARYLRPEAADELIGYLIANIAFAATAATLWWFGDRAPKPPELGGSR